MRIYDISLGLSPDLPVWPGDPPIVLKRVSKIEDGANANVSHFSGSVHVGTHVDAPVHFLRDGVGIEAIPLEAMIGRAYVIDLSKETVLGADTFDRAGIPPRTKRLLLKTRNSELWKKGVPTFQEDFVAVNPSGAEWLTRKGVRLVGIDYLSIAPYKKGKEPHNILLGAGIVILEGLNLSEVNQGRYNLYCLPLKLLGSDGAPARAILTGV